MRVLMLGWEFPPYISGGLGTACHGLTRAMAALGNDILFALPRAETLASAERVEPGDREQVKNHLARKSAEARSAQGGASRLQGWQGEVQYQPVPAEFHSPYQSAMGTVAPQRIRHDVYAQPPVLMEAGPQRVRRLEPRLKVFGAGLPGGYDGDLLGKVQQFSRRCERLVSQTHFDIIHAHDWMTFEAGQAVAKASGKPLVVHVHSTEFDRSGESFHPETYEVERRGMHQADRVICVSHWTRSIVLRRYDVPASKVDVVHNGIDRQPVQPPQPVTRQREPVVLFLGRLTRQKGPHTFVEAAALVLRTMPRVKFVIAGWGDLAPQVIEHVARLNLGHRILFTGFLHGEQVNQAYRNANVYVMPSVSEPFGLTAFEAVRLGVPSIISRASGVAEVLKRGALHVDPGDAVGIADLILLLLSHPTLGRQLHELAKDEIREMDWSAAAHRCVKVYRNVLASRQVEVPDYELL